MNNVTHICSQAKSHCNLYLDISQPAVKSCISNILQRGTRVQHMVSSKLIRISDRVQGLVQNVCMGYLLAHVKILLLEISYNMQPSKYISYYKEKNFDYLYVCLLFVMVKF